MPETRERRPTSFLTSRRTRIVLLVLLVAVLAWVRFRPRTDEARVRAVFADLREDWLDHDFDDVWDRFCRESRESIDEDEFVRSMESEEARAGVNQWSAILRSIRVTSVEIDGDRARLRAGTPDRAGDLYAEFVREDGTWLLDGAAWLDPFKTLARKMSAWLPKSPIPAADVDVVIRAGPEAPADADLDALATLLAGRASDRADAMAVVVLDLSPDLSWQGAVRYLDTAYRAGRLEVAFARADDGPYAPGITVDGVALATAAAAGGEIPAPDPAVADRLIVVEPPR